VLAVVGIVVVAGIAGAIAIPLLTGATGHASSQPTLVPGHSSTPAVSVPPFVGVQGDIPSATGINGDPKLRDDVAMTGCQQTSTGWQASGSAKDSTQSARSLSLVVIFTDAQARAITSAKTTVATTPGATEQWSVSATFRAPAGTKCVLAGVDTTVH
jgi:hypothetical protein